MEKALKELVLALKSIANALMGKTEANDDKNNDFNFNFTDLYGIKAIKITDINEENYKYKQYAIPLKLYAKDPSDIPDFENKFANKTLLATDLFGGNVVELVKLIQNIIKNEPDADYQLVFDMNYEKFYENHEYYSIGSGYSVREFGTQSGIKGIGGLQIAHGYSSIMIDFRYQQNGNCGWYYDNIDLYVDNLLTIPVQGTTTD